MILKQRMSLRFVALIHPMTSADGGRRIPASNSFVRSRGVVPIKENGENSRDGIGFAGECGDRFQSLPVLSSLSSSRTLREGVAIKVLRSRLLVSDQTSR